MAEVTADMKRARTIILIAALPLLIACGELKIIPSEDSAGAEDIPVVITGLELRSYTGDQVVQVIEAASAELYHEDRRTLLQTVSLEFYENSEPVSILNAVRGEISLDQDSFLADERVRIIRLDQGATLYATHFTYDPDTETLFSDAPFALVQETADGSVREIRGIGVTTDRRLEQIDFRQPGIRTLTDFDREQYERNIFETLTEESNL